LRTTTPPATAEQKRLAQAEVTEAFTIWDNCLKRTRGQSGGETCRESEKAFDDAAGAFEAACGDAGLPRSDKEETNPDKSGAIGCSWSINRCVCLQDNVSSDDKVKYKCDEGSGSRRNSNSSAFGSQGIGLIDLGQAKDRMKFCPQADSDDTERYEKQLKDSQDRVRDLKKKMPELMNKGSEAQDKAEQAQNEARRKAADAQKEFGNEMKEIKRKKEADEQQAVAEVTATREKMDQLDAQIRQLEMSKVDAEVKLSEARTQIELNCHATASQQVSARQTAKLAAIKQAQSQGSFNRLMNSVGVSSRAAWEKVAEVYYKRCLNSRPTRDSKKSAQNIYESTIRQVDSAISTARIQRRSIEDNLKQIMTTNGCGTAPMQANGMTGESRMCRSLRQAQEDAQQAYNNQMQQQQLVQQEMATAQRQQATKNQALNTEYIEAQRELVEEQSRMENLRAYLNLRRERKQGSSSKKAGEDLGPSLGKLRGAARTFDSCCKSEDGWTTTKNEKCANVMKFLEHLEIPSAQKGLPGDRPDEEETPRPAPPATVPAPSPPATPPASAT
jgi:hypothetical protein